MAFEIEVLNARYNFPEDKIWQIISLSWELIQYEPYQPPYQLNAGMIPDIRRTKEWRGDYDGIAIEITFSKDGDKLILLGVTHIGSGPLSRHEHLLGYVEVSRVLISAESPVDVRMICCWKPFYLFFVGMADYVQSFFKQKYVDHTINELLEFKSLVERQTHKDIFVAGQAQENIARALLQTFLIRRSYREIQIRGGKSDILVFARDGRFLYETKIWRGEENYKQGLREIEEYILGEDTDHELSAVFFVIFDPTASSAAHKYLGSDLATEIVANHTIHVFVINICPPRPSKKPEKML